MPRSDTCQTGGGQGPGCDVPVGLNRLLTDALTRELIGVEEVLEEAVEEAKAIGGHGLLDPGEHAGIHALRVVSRLQQARKHTGNDHGLAQTFGTVLSQLANHLAASRGEAGQGEITHMRHRLVKALCRPVSVVASGCL
jgi:hypothetical protein